VPGSQPGVFNADVESSVVWPDVRNDKALLELGRLVQPEPLLVPALDVSAGDHVAAVGRGTGAVSPVDALALRRVARQAHGVTRTRFHFHACMQTRL